MSEHCVRHCTLMMVCGILLGKAKTTKVGMVWYELNKVNQLMSLQGRYRSARAAKKRQSYILSLVFCILGDYLFKGLLKFPI